MFSSIFGKRRSPVEVEVEEETPPIPGARSDDGFVVVDPSSPRSSLYPNVGGGGIVAPQAQRAAPPAPKQRAVLIDPTFHYLQGVPFSMSKTLQMASNKDAFATEVADLLAFLTNKVNVSSYEYDFSVEKSVLKEC